MTAELAVTRRNACGDGRSGSCDPVLDAITDWFDANERTLPWRVEPRDPWAVLVSEVMLQQTPVRRVVPVYEAWLQRWPTAADLAAEPVGEAVRMWGRLGYPRRALRLHGAATAVVAHHDGELPTSYDDLIRLPGIGDYTAAAVLAFAHKQRIPVLDTNVRRVLARIRSGTALPASGGPSRSERDLLTDALPDAPRAARVSEALMEFGALLCTAQSPDCEGCPVAGECAWRGAGHPPAASSPRSQARFDGSDRQVRGLILALLRDAPGPVPQSQIDEVWPESEQRDRAQASLAADGLLVITDGRVTLP